MTMPAVLDAEDLAALERHGRRRRFRSGECLVREGSSGTTVLAMADGRAKVGVVSPSGREVLLAIKGPGDLVGEYAAIDGRPRSATVTALETVEVVVVDADAFQRFLDERPRVALRLLRQLAAQLRQAGQDSVDRDHGEVTARVARRLVDLAQRFGEHNGPTIAIALTLTQDDLAAWVGASREATNRALANLRTLGCLRTGRQRIVVTDLAVLRQQAA